MADERDIPHFNKMANESKQTAVDWLYNNLKSHFEHDGDLLEAVQFSFNQAKEMEKKQIIDAWEDGQSELSLKDKQEYYTETFGK
jgi:hemerythrin